MCFEGHQCCQSGPGARLSCWPNSDYTPSSGNCYVHWCPYSYSYLIYHLALVNFLVTRASVSILWSAPNSYSFSCTYLSDPLHFSPVIRDDDSCRKAAWTSLSFHWGSRAYLGIVGFQLTVTPRGPSSKDSSYCSPILKSALVLTSNSSN